MFRCDGLPNFSIVTGSCAEGDTGMYTLEKCHLKLKKSHLMRTLNLPRRLSSMLDFQQNRSLIQNAVDGRLARIVLILSSELGIHPLPLSTTKSSKLC